MQCVESAETLPKNFHQSRQLSVSQGIDRYKKSRSVLDINRKCPPANARKSQPPGPDRPYVVLGLGKQSLRELVKTCVNFDTIKEDFAQLGTNAAFLPATPSEGRPTLKTEGAEIVTILLTRTLLRLIEKHGLRPEADGRVPPPRFC